MKLNIEWVQREIVGPSPRAAQKEAFRFQALVPHDFRDLRERGGPYWAILVTPPGGDAITVMDNDGRVYLFTKIIGEERYRLDAEIERLPPEGMHHHFPGVTVTLRGVEERPAPVVTMHVELDGGGIGMEIEIKR